MEVSNEIKEEIRKTQTDLKNAIRIHQVWVSRLQEDENNALFKTKVQETERQIIAIGQAQKLVVDRLRRELELYQQRLRSRNKQVNIENDTLYIAQQLKEHQVQYKNRSRPVSLLKPSVLNEIHVKTERNHDEYKENNCDSDSELKLSEKENSIHSDTDEREKYPRNFRNLGNAIHDSRNNFANALNKVKEAFSGNKDNDEWQDLRTDSESSQGEEISPSPSPPPLPGPGEEVTQETFLRLLGLLTQSQKELLDKKRSERRKRSTTSTNKNEYLYGNFDMCAKRKKYDRFPYLQSNNDPPQTRSAKLKKQQGQNKSSREGSPSGSSTENKSWSNKPAWAATLPASLSVEPIYPTTKKVCHGCGRSDAPSLLVWCAACSVWQHTSCGAGRCGTCRRALPEPDAAPAHTHHLYSDKIAERKRLQERNIELCRELRKLEARAASLKDNLDEHNAEKRQLLAAQIKTQRNLQKLLDFISQFKETSISIRSTSVSETESEISKSNEE